MDADDSAHLMHFNVSADKWTRKVHLYTTPFLFALINSLEILISLKKMSLFQEAINISQCFLSLLMRSL